MIATSSNLKESREKFQKNKSSIAELLKLKTNQEDIKSSSTGFLRQSQGSQGQGSQAQKQKQGKIETLYAVESNNPEHLEAKEWLNKLDVDLEEINKISPNANANKEKSKSKHETSKEKRICNVDKSLEKIEKQVNLLNKTAKETNYKTKSTGRRRKEEEKKERKKTPEVRKNESTIVKTTISSPKYNKISFDNLKNLNDEIDHIKEFCKDLKSKVESNIMIDKDKKAFGKMKNDFIKQSADINIMKEDMGELMKNLHFLMRRMDVLEEENKNLRRHNQNLVKFVKNMGKGDRALANHINILEVSFIS